jgi:hypothetical protein
MPKMPHPNRLILPEEAVAYLGLDQQGLRHPRESLRWLCRTGRLRYAKVGRYLRFRLDWLDEFIERNSVPQSPRHGQLPPRPPRTPRSGRL